MPCEEGARVIDRCGQSARITQPIVDGEPVVAVLESGGAVRIPADLLVRQDRETLVLVGRFEDLSQENQPHGNQPQEDDPSRRVDPPEADQAEWVIPVVAEQARVHRERIVTGRVRLRKVVHQEEQTIDEPVLKEQVSVERVPIDRWVDAAPPIRSEGETLIVPVVEEVLVVEKRLRLREEVRVTWHHQEEHEPQQLVVRREEVRIERVPGDSGLHRTGRDDTPHLPPESSEDAEPRP